MFRTTLSRALLIHDNPAERDAVLETLSRSALDTTVLCNAKQAWIYLFQNERPAASPELIILKAGLSPVSGLDILRQLRTQPDAKETPIIILADSKEEQRALEALDLPLCFCFMKPLTFAKLIYALPRLHLSISDSLIYCERES